MQDRRDPHKLGTALLHRHAEYKERSKKGTRSLSATYDANVSTLDKIENHDAKHVGPVGKYGKPGNITVLEEARGPVIVRN